MSYSAVRIKPICTSFINSMANIDRFYVTEFHRTPSYLGIIPLLVVVPTLHDYH